MSRAIGEWVSAGVLAATCLSLGGCLGVPAATGPVAMDPRPEPPNKMADPRVDEVTRRILQAAGLDPSDPSRPNAIGPNVAGVVQVRFNGRSYGTALAKLAPGRIVFTDPDVVASMLGGPAAKDRFVAALRGPIVDIDSRDCRFNQKFDRRTRKAFKLPKICPQPSGTIWADLNRRQMTVDLKMQSEYAAVTQPSSVDFVLAEASQTPVAPPAKTLSLASINLIEPASLATATPKPAEETTLAAAPISLKPPVRLLMPRQTASADPTPAQAPWAVLLAPFQQSKYLSSNPAREAVLSVEPADATAVAPAGPAPATTERHRDPAGEAAQSTAVSSDSAAYPPSPVLAASSFSAAPSSGLVGSARLNSTLLSSTEPVREVEGAYGGDHSAIFSNVTVISGAYPLASTNFR